MIRIMALVTRKIGSDSITVCFEGQRFTMSISNKTSCDKLIRQLTEPMNTDPTTYTLFESAYGIERALAASTKLKKQIRSWGADKENYSLILQKLEKIKVKRATPSQAFKKLRRIRSMFTGNRDTEFNKNMTHIKCNLDDRTEKKYLDKNIQFEEIQIDNIRRRPLKYVHNTKHEHIGTSNKRNVLVLPERTQGDGCESGYSVSISVRAHGDGQDSHSSVQSTRTSTHVHGLDKSSQHGNTKRCSKYKPCDMKCFHLANCRQEVHDLNTAFLLDPDDMETENIFQDN